MSLSILDDNEISGDDFRVMTYRLNEIFEQYRKLLLHYSFPKKRDKTKDANTGCNIDTLNIGINCSKLFKGARAFTLTIPKSFGFEPLRIDIPDHSDKSIPHNLILPLDDAVFIATRKNYSAIGEKQNWIYGKGEWTGLGTTDIKYLRAGDGLPVGYAIRECLQVGGIWLDYLDAVFTFNFATLEWILPKRYICPTLNGMGVSLGELLPMIGENKQVSFFSKYDEICREFRVMQAELHREWLRSSGKKKVLIINGKNSTHPSRLDNPSVPFKIGLAAEKLGFGRGTPATKKLNRYMEKYPDYAIPVPGRNSYYWFNRNYPGVEVLPADTNYLKEQKKE